MKPDLHTFLLQARLDDMLLPFTKSNAHQAEPEKSLGEIST